MQIYKWYSDDIPKWLSDKIKIKHNAYGIEMFLTQNTLSDTNLNCKKSWIIKKKSETCFPIHKICFSFKLVQESNKKYIYLFLHSVCIYFFLSTRINLVLIIEITKQGI